MAYKPPRAKGGDTIRNVGKFIFSKNKDAIQVKFQDGSKQVFKDFPEFLSPKLQKEKLQFSFPKEGDKLFGVSPVQGMFRGRVVNYLGRDEGGPPTIRHKSYENYGYDYFLVEIEITAPEKYRGVQFSHMLRYNYREVDDNGRSVVGYASRGRHTEHLIEFDNCTGIWEGGPMPWKENVLPMVAKRALHYSREFKFSMKECWINDFYPDAGVPTQDEGVQEDDPFWNDDDEAEENLTENENEFEEDFSDDEEGLDFDEVPF